MREIPACVFLGDMAVSCTGVIHYLQSKWYVRLIETGRTKLRLNCNLHFSEGEMFFQQALNLSVTVGTLAPPERSNSEYPWMRFFQ